MKTIMGIVVGCIISAIGSALISLVPYIPFGSVFLATILPSIFVFVIVTYQTNSDDSKFKKWLTSFLALFVIGIVAFTIKNYFEVRSIVDISGSSLNWDAVLLFNILYSLGAALIISPVGYVAIQWVSHFKDKYALESRVEKD